MRIALVSHEYPPFRGGGIGTYATIMSDAFARAGHEVHVITNRYPSDDPVHGLKTHRDGNLWVHRIDALTGDWEPAPPHDQSGDLLRQLYDWSPYLYYAELVVEELERVCGEYDLDIAEFPECAAEGYGVLRRKRRGLAFADLPITMTLHSPIWEIYHYNLYSKYDVGFQRRNTMEEYCIRNADALNAPSRLLSEIVSRRLGLCPETLPCDVIPLPMDFDQIPDPEALEAASPDGDEPFLLFVGRLEPRKGVRLLVDAAVRLMDSHPKLNVHLVGRDCAAGECPGSMVGFLRRRIPRKLQDRFVFHGVIPREELFAYYRAAAACVFPAPWDNFPLTCAEAMACGGSVVASDYSGMAEMIEDGKSGLLFRSGDLDSLTATIARALDEEGLAATVCNRAADRIRKVCDLDAAVSNRIAHYEKAIELHRGRSTRRAAAPARRRIALFVVPSVRPEDMERSVDAARTAAASFGADLEVTTGGDDEPAAAGPVSGDGRRGDGEDALAGDLQRWLERLAGDEPDYLMVLRAGETVESPYFSVTARVLDQEPDTAWATTWSLPAAGAAAPPYAGLDFTLPLDLLVHQPVPFALIRYDAFRSVGGWNFELPPGWREWCLWLAFAQAGLNGVTVPCWLGRFVPRRDPSAGPSEHDHMLGWVLDRVVESYPDVFNAHSTTLWRYRMLNSVTTLPPESSAGADTTEHWRHWWRLTKSCLKRQFPRSARLYRRWFRSYR